MRLTDQLRTPDPGADHAQDTGHEIASLSGDRWWRRVLAAWREWPRRRKLVLGAAIVLLAAMVGWFVLARSAESAPQTITATVTSGEATRSVSASGTLEPATTEDLEFAVSGTVTEVLVALGDQVSEGQVLARVDGSLAQAELTAAEAALTAAEDELDSAESSGSSTQEAAAQAQLVTAQDGLDAARADVAATELRSSFAGQVVSLETSVGDVVGGSSTSSGTGGATGGFAPDAASSDSSSTTSSTIQVASVDSFVIETTVSSSDLDSISTDLQAEITASGVEETLYGTVSEIGRVATTNSAGGAVFPVIITVTGSAPEGVFGGTSATVDIIVEKRSDVLTVSTQAVRSEDGQTYVMVVADGGTTRRDVEVGETYGASTEILSGLEEGEEVELATVTGGGPGGGGQVPDDFEIPGGGEVPDGFEVPEGGFPGGGGGFPGGGVPGGGQ